MAKGVRASSAAEVTTASGRGPEWRAQQPSDHDRSSIQWHSKANAKAAMRRQRSSKPWTVFKWAGRPPAWLLGMRQGAFIPVMTLCRSPQAPASFEPSKGQFRFWIDYQVLSSPASAALLERALVASGGKKTGGPPKLDALSSATVKIKDYGYMHMDAWDLLWTITAKAMLAAEILRPGQMVSIVPGFLCISRKTSLVRSLRSVYGDEAAFQIVPRTFKLPEEMDEWAAWIARHPREDTGLWMLKNNKQRGTGLRLVRTGEAFDACFETTTRPGLEGMVLYRWYLAQRYITDPLLLGGFKSGLRVWVLVPDTRPLRVYLHCNGLVLFSDTRYNAEEMTLQDGNLPSGHVTNYAQNENGQVWSLERLKVQLGQAAFAKIWSQIETSVALTFASALPRALEVQAEMALPPRSCFQFFGLDFILDAALKPWLLEANATPSMKVEHVDPGVERMIHDQKWPVIRDMVRMLGICSERFNPDRREHRDLGFMRQELEARGGFRPLMHLFPEETQEGLRILPWGGLDVMMRNFVRTRQYEDALH